MQPQSAKTIDLQAAYPCPCGRHGRLSPIALTEAFGCDYCQQIFVAKQAGQRLVPLASHASESRMWYWTGQRWRLDRSSIQKRSLFLVITLLVLSLPLILLIWPHVPVSIRVLLRFLTVMVLMAVILGGVWFAYRP